jgi:putative ABC transport system substrate-binding protein
MAVISDPVAAGFVKSLARPGSNLTGLTNLGSGLAAKRLELLKEAVPRLSRVAVLRNPTKQALDPLLWNESQAAAHLLGATLLSFEVRRPEEFEGAFASMKREHIDGLVVLPDSFFFNHRTRIVELETRNRIPTMHDTREFVDASLSDLWRRAAGYVDKILKGAKPADLPVEQPTKFELVINLKTAKALGLTVPQALLSRADEIIQ